MAMSNLVSNNEEHIKDALYSGIEAEAVESTLGDVITKTDRNGKTPKQVQEMVETIVEMKKDTVNKIDESYESDFVKENSNKIKDALNEGISSKEIAQTLIYATDKAKDRKSKKHLKFITKLISKMKVKEFNLKNKKANKLGGRQKVFSNK